MRGSGLVRMLAILQDERARWGRCVVGEERRGELTVPAAWVVGALAEAREHAVAVDAAALQANPSGR